MMEMKDSYWYIVTVVINSEVTNKNGDAKTVSTKEDWLINAVSVTDAEAKANADITKITAKDKTFEFRVKDVKESRITKVIE
jgi:hypothetical protein